MTQGLERLYTCREVGDMWKLSHTTIIKLFRDEPGVLKLTGEGKTQRTRHYMTLRIPESVVIRVYERMSR